MNKLVFALLVVASPAFADPPAVSPFGTTPFVVAYAPPPVADPAHHGFTLEFALGGGSTSTDASTGAFTFAIGGWLSHDLSLAFRVSEAGSFQFIGGSAQLFATPSLWFGAGIGGLAERTMDDLDGPSRISGTGGFARAGFNLAEHGAHALYLSAELQAGAIGDTTRAVALVTLGYQLL